MTRVPTALRSLSARSIFTRSSRCRLIEATARGSWSSARVIAGFCLFSEIASRLRLSMARTIWSLLVSSWPMNTSSWVSTDRTLPSRPPSALFSSVEMVFSWATPPPLSSRDSAPRTSSTSGLRPLRASGIVSPSPRRPLEAPVGRRGQRDELLAQQAGLPDRGLGVVRQLHALAQQHRHLGVVAVDLDVVDLADGDVVDLDRRLRDQVEHVAELDRDRVRVVPEVRAAGQRQAVDGEVAAGEREGSHHGQRRPAHHAGARRAGSRRPAVIADLQDPAERAVHVFDVRGRRCRGRLAQRRRAGQDVAELGAGLARVAVRAGGDDPAQRAERVTGDLADVLPHVRPRVQGAGRRVVGVEQVGQRGRRDLEDLVERAALLDQHLHHPVEPLDVAARARRGSPSRSPRRPSSPPPGCAARPPGRPARP